MTMVRIACPCGRFFLYFHFPEALEQLRPHRRYHCLAGMKESPLQQKGLSISQSPRNSQTVSKTQGTLWHLCSAQQPSLQDTNLDLVMIQQRYEQSSEKLLVTVRKKKQKADHKSGHQMNSECTNKTRASNKFHFRQNRNVFLVEVRIDDTFRCVLSQCDVSTKMFADKQQRLVQRPHQLHILV